MIPQIDNFLVVGWHQQCHFLLVSLDDNDTNDNDNDGMVRAAREDERERANGLACWVNWFPVLISDLVDPCDVWRA